MTTISVPEGVRNNLKYIAEKLGVSQRTVIEALVYMTGDPYVWTTLSNIVRAYAKKGGTHDQNREEILPPVQGNKNA